MRSGRAASLSARGAPVPRRRTQVQFMACSRSNFEIYGRLSAKLSAVPLIRARMSREICDLSEGRIEKAAQRTAREAK
ncbi:hypothetical protein Trydic_g23679 [Trypoxylus dichotomus]